MAKKTVITEVLDVEVNESMIEFPQNRAFMTEKLTYDDPTRPEVVKGLQTVDEVFEHYQPKVDVEFQDSEGVPNKETLKFNNLGGFGMKGITAQSDFLQGMDNERELYQKIIKQLKSNKPLKNTIHALLSELEGK